MRHLAFLTALIIASPLLGFDLSNLPGKPEPLFGNLSAETLRTFGNAEGTAFAIVSVEGQPFTKAVQVKTPRTTPVWNTQVSSGVNNKIPVKRGDTVFVAFMVRCPKAETESGCGDLYATLQEAKVYESYAYAYAAPGQEWRPLYLRFRASQDLPPEKFNLTLHLGRANQTLELADFIAVNLGPDIDQGVLPYNRITYAGREPDAPWRKEALERIEKIRKGGATLRLTTPDGAPLPNVKVRAQLTRHLYQFGTFLDSNVLLQETPDGKKYRETVMQLFNRATCPLYWSDWGWESPEGRMMYFAKAQWAKSNGLYTRGHCLVWPGWKNMPKRIEPLKDNPAALKAAIDDHLTEIATLMRPIKFDTYDVVNEPRVNHAVQDILGQQEMANWFKLVNQLDPRPKLCLNEYNIISGGGNSDAEIETFIKQIRTLLDFGAPLGVIGVQCHIGENLTPPDKIVSTLDRLAVFKLPVHATEFDIATDDWEVQGDYLRDFLIAFFSHPATESVTQWGFWEKSHWIPRAALFTRDWRVKPAGQAYIDLVNGEWKTDVTGETDAQGVFRTRGFFGDYEITLTFPDGRTVTRTLSHTRDNTAATWQY